MVIETNQLLETVDSSEKEPMENSGSSDEETEFDESAFDGLQSTEEN